MSEHADNFAESPNAVAASPSIFHILGHENLSNLIEPTLIHLLKLAAERRPESFQKFFQHSEELCCFVRLLLECYFLKRHGSSFSEYFYSLKRIPSSNIGNQNNTDIKLPKTLMLKYIFFLVIFPYLKRKLDSLFNKHMDEAYRGNSRVSRSKLKRAFLGIYPFLHASLEGSTLAFQLAHAGGYSKFHSLQAYLSGVTLAYVQPGEVQEESVPSWMEIFKNGCTFRNMKPLTFKLLKSFESLVASAFSASLFFIQFLEWWYNNNMSSSIKGLPDPGCPKSLLTPDLNPLVMILCPLCRRKRVQDTAISVSGFVFCYPCVVSYVKEHSRCPVTGYPCQVEHLIRLYLTTS